MWATAAGVHKGTDFVRMREHHPDMRKKTAKRESNKIVLARVTKEMAGPRMATSTRNEVAVLAAAGKKRRKRLRRTAA